jgi:hypothetical protein
MSGRGAVRILLCDLEANNNNDSKAFCGMPPLAGEQPTRSGHALVN